MQGNSKGPSRKRASTPGYVSPNQLVLPGFETPFEQKLTRENRWVKLAHNIPWDRLVKYYDDLFPSKEGRPPISGRVILGAVIIKHMGDLTDRETVAQIQENMFMQPDCRQAGIFGVTAALPMRNHFQIPSSRRSGSG